MEVVTTAGAAAITEKSGGQPAAAFTEDSAQQLHTAPRHFMAGRSSDRVQR